LNAEQGIDEQSSLEDIAALVCTELERDGIQVVLSGGSVVSIYSNAEFVSYDLDFIPIGLSRRVDRTMKRLGFEPHQRHWRHPRSRYWVEFPVGPVAIGEETIHDFAERSTPAGMLRLLRPTECVMDRLTWFIHASDRQCLEQAVRVATLQPIELSRIERWARKEGPNGGARFEEFRRRLEGSRRNSD